MSNVINAYTKNGSIDMKSSSLIAFASTKDIDRDEEIIEPSAFTESLVDFRKNPVVLWAHDHGSLPIAKSLQEEITTDGLLFNPKFADHQFAKDVWELYKGSYLNAFSVGFIPKASEERDIDGRKIRAHIKVELLEVSAVPVPSNRGAVALRQITGSDSLKEISEKQMVEALIKFDLEYKAKSEETQKRMDAELSRLINKLIELNQYIKNLYKI